LRVLGYVPVWLAAAAVLWVEDGRRVRFGRPAHLIDRWSRGALVGVSAVGAGAVAEAGKLVFRRRRPPDGGVWDRDYAWKPWSEDAWSTGGVGLPSSHAAVAVGALAMAWTLWPRHRWWLAGLAVGCCFQRVAAGAHFVSDVTAAALVGVGVAALAWRGHWWVLRRRVFGG
jgi:membrane-associated phospholipid phosphatase